MASKRSVVFAVVMSLVLCGVVIWLVVSVRMEENDKTAQAETYELIIMSQLLLRQYIIVNNTLWLHKNSLNLLMAQAIFIEA